MKEYTIEVTHTPSGQYFTLTASYDEDYDYESIVEDIAKDLSIDVEES
jgi:hypothetical protein